MKKDFSVICVWACLGLTVVGVGTHFYLSRRLERAKADTPRALEILKDIARLRADIAFLNGELEQDQFRDQSQYYVFFEDQAKNAQQMPTPQIPTGPRDDTPSGAKGFKDRRFDMKWGRSAGSKEKQTFTREQIGTFCFNIETYSKLVKVTEIDLRAADTKTWDDTWELTMSVTERRPTSAPAAPTE